MPPENTHQNNQNSHSPVTDILAHLPHKPASPVAPSIPPPAVVVPPVTSPEVVSPLPPSTPAPVVTSKPLTLEEEISQKENVVKLCALQRIQIEEESKGLISQRKKLEEEIAPVLHEEKIAIEKIAVLEEQRLKAEDPHEARLIETSRWAEEENRRGIERRKWDIEAEAEVVTGKIKESELAFNALLGEEDSCVHAIAQLRIKVAQRDLGAELAEITNEKVATEAELQRFAIERERLETLLREMAHREKDALLAEEIVEKKTEGIRGLYEEQVLATERHKLEDARKDAEQKRWAAEDALLPVSHSAEESSKHLNEIKMKEAEIIEKLKSL